MDNGGNVSLSDDEVSEVLHFFFWQILILRSVISWLQSICKKTAHGVVLEVVHVIHADLVSTICITKLVEFYHVDLRLC